MTDVQVTSLTKDFGAFRAVDDVTFSVTPGEITGFIGANGSGKTTTMRMMLDLVVPTGGSTHFGGVPYKELHEPRRTVGAVVDRIGAHPSHSARRHLTMIARAARLPADRVDAALREVDLFEVADNPIRQFSMGMTQRCALAAALLGSPSVLILDEPANGLDAAGIRWLRNKTKAWADEGRSVILSTHQLAELSAVVDRLVVLDRGRVVHQGRAAEFTGTNKTLESAVFELLADLDVSAVAA